MIRNLLFHCYPVKGTIWPWHVEQLLKYRPVWNGRRLIVVVTDHTTDPIDQVLKAFAPLECELFVTRNQSFMSETYHFIEALSILQSDKDDEATFYAHSKGVTRKGALEPIVQRWSDIMYRLNLKRPDLVDKRLRQYPTVGSLRIRMPHGGSSWCFAGTFFWLRHDALFSRNWRDVMMERYGVEGYPGRHFKFEESYSFNPECVPPMSLYNGWISEDVIKSWEKRLMDERA